MSPRTFPGAQGNSGGLRFSTPRVKMMMHEMSPIAAIEGGFCYTMGGRIGDAGALRQQPPAWQSPTWEVPAMGSVSIPLHSRKYPNHFALVDEEDYERVSRYRWRVVKTRGSFYAVTGPRGASVLLHRFVLGALEGSEVDHIDGNGLHCVRKNLRPATHAQNMCNRKLHVNNVSGFKGVQLQLKSGRWRARIWHASCQINIGSFSTPEAAAHAYDAKAQELFGDFARLNFPR